MIEESLNFGMNAVQLSKVSDLQSHISELDQSLESILNNLDAMQQDQAEAIEKQETEHQRQEIEYQKQQIILKLRESVFNFKTNMEDVYQSDELTIENKYLQFRDACMSSAVQTLNPDYFETFKDKDYVVSVKKYLINTRDELFESLEDGKKSIIKTLESSEKKFEEMVNLGIQKPNLSTEPLFDKNKLKNIDKPIMPKDYNFNKKMWQYTDSHFKEIFLFITLISIVAGITSAMDETSELGILGGIFLGGIWFFGLFFLAVAFGSETKEVAEIYSAYENSLFEYLKQEESNKNLLEEYEDKLQYYKDNQKTILQSYQNELKGYQDHQDNIEILKQEIVGLRQSFCS